MQRPFTVGLVACPAFFTAIPSLFTILPLALREGSAAARSRRGRPRPGAPRRGFRLRCAGDCAAGRRGARLRHGDCLTIPITSIVPDGQRFPQAVAP
jgi:hypothetical protein